MSYPRLRPHAYLCAGLMAAFVPHAALAADADEVAARLKALMEKQGMEASWSGIAGDGSRMTMEGVTVKPAGEDEAFALGNIELSDIREDGDTIIVGTLAMPSYTFSNEGVNVAIDGISVTGLQLAADGDDSVAALVGYYESADMDFLRVTREGRSLFMLEQLHVEMSPLSDDAPLEFSGAAEKFTADLTTIEDAQTKAVVQALGYETINGYLELSGSWSPTDGRMVLDQYDISVDQAGTIGMTFDIGGYTMEFMQALRDIQAKMGDNEGQDQSAQGMAMLGLMQQLTLNGATLRFDDDTLTQKALEFVAAQQGAKPAAIVNQAKAILPFAMAQLNNPELTAAVSAAVGKFLDDPRSLEIRVAPETPLPFAMVAAGAMTAPQALPQQLGMKITANE